MKKTLLFFALISVFALPFCSTSKNASGKKKEVVLMSYQTDISPILQVHCTPCHFPVAGGKKAPLDSYEAARTNIDAILYRVQLPATDMKFMPFMSKKEPLSDSLIQVIKLWKDQETPG